MTRHALPWCLLLLTSAVGCSGFTGGDGVERDKSSWSDRLFGQKPTPEVPPDPFRNTTTPTQYSATNMKLTPATEQAKERVITVGTQVITSNKQLGMRPLLMTVGKPEPEICHQGTGSIIITEGLVQKCATDGQLAAVLALEMGKMVSEREAQADVRARLLARQEPMSPHIGNDGGPGSADMVFRAEQAQLDGPRRAAMAPPAPPPDPQALARTYLHAAGYSPTDLDAVAPLLKDASANYSLEKMFTSSQGSAPPAPPLGPTVPH